MSARYAPHGFCPAFNCGRPLPSRHAVVCEDHYFSVEAKRMRAAMRMKIKADREADPERRAVFADQANKHAKAIADDLRKRGRA